MVAATGNMVAPGKLRRFEKATDLDRERAAFLSEMLPRIYGYILLRVNRDPGIAEDLTQETLLAYTRQQQSGVAIANPTAMLFGIARHKVVDWYRARVVLTADPDETLAVVDPVDDLERVLQRDELLRYLDQLPPGQRMVLILHYADGLSAAEIALHLGKTRDAVESLLARGRRAMRQLASKQGEAR